MEGARFIEELEGVRDGKWFYIKSTTLEDSSVRYSRKDGGALRVRGRNHRANPRESSFSRSSCLTISSTGNNGDNGGECSQITNPADCTKTKESMLLREV
jgi:hypothetical protein